MSDPIQTAIIAGVSALLGGLLANWNARTLHRMDEAKALRQFYRQKLERIAELISASLDWWIATSSMSTIQSLASDKRCPEVRQAYSLACLYFPKLRELISAYSDSMVEMHSFFIDVCDPESSLCVSAQASNDPRYEALIEQMRRQRQEIENSIFTEAKSFH